MSGNGGNLHSLRDLPGTYEKSGLEQALNSGVPPPVTPEFPGIQPPGFKLVFHTFPQLTVNRLAPTLLFGVNGGQAAGEEGARVLVCRKLVAHHPGGAKHRAQLAGAEGWVVLLNTLQDAFTTGWCRNNVTDVVRVTEQVANQQGRRCIDALSGALAETVEGFYLQPQRPERLGAGQPEAFPEDTEQAVFTAENRLCGAVVVLKICRLYVLPVGPVTFEHHLVRVQVP